MMSLSRSMGVVLPILCAQGALAQAIDKTIFITNKDSGTVSSMRVNLDGTLSYIASTAVGAYPQDCAISADGRRLVVMNSNTDQTGPEALSVFSVNPNGTLDGPIAATTIADAPLALGLSRNGFALVPSISARELQSLRLDSAAVVPVNTQPAGQFPFRPVISADNRWVFCAGSISPDDIVTFSLAPDGMLARQHAIDIPNAAAFGIALHPTLPVLYVSTGQANTINWYSINQVTGTLTFGGSVNPGGNSVTELAVTPNGKWLFSTHTISDTVHVTKINANGSLTSTIFSNSVTSDIRDVVTDGKFAYVSDETLLGGAVGIHAFLVSDFNGALIPLGPAVSTKGFKPQFMALWAPPFCLGDADRNGAVEFSDVTAVLNNFNGVGPVGDANDDGVVNFMDITAVLDNVGTCDAG